MSARAHGFESHPLRSLKIQLNLEFLKSKFNSVKIFGEVPKLAEGTPLERVQVVNSGARVQIPPSALHLEKDEKVVDKAKTL